MSRQLVSKPSAIVCAVLAFIALTGCQQRVKEPGAIAPLACAMKAPSDGAMHLLAGKIAIDSGQIEIASGELERARTYAPRNAEAFYLSGFVAQRMDQPESARAFYEKARTLAPDNLAYLLAESDSLVAMNRSGEALSLLQSKFVVFQDTPGIRDAIGQLLMEGGQYQNALAMFQGVASLSESDLLVNEHVALALYANEEYQACAETLDELTVDPTCSRRSDLLTVLGDCQLQLSHPRDAQATLTTATELCQTSSRTFQLLGQADLECGDIRAAERDLARSVALNDKNSESQLLLGYSQLRTDQFGLALETLEKATPAETNETMGLCVVGYVLEKMGRTQDATRWYGRALHVRPGDELASQLMATIDPADPAE